SIADPRRGGGAPIAEGDVGAFHLLPGGEGARESLVHPIVTAGGMPPLAHGPGDRPPFPLQALLAVGGAAAHEGVRGGRDAKSHEEKDEEPTHAHRAASGKAWRRSASTGTGRSQSGGTSAPVSGSTSCSPRSEERRVGNEGRSRGSPAHEQDTK